MALVESLSRKSANRSGGAGSGSAEEMPVGVGRGENEALSVIVGPPFADADATVVQIWGAPCAVRHKEPSLSDFFCHMVHATRVGGIYMIPDLVVDHLIQGAPFVIFVLNKGLVGRKTFIHQA